MITAVLGTTRSPCVKNVTAMQLGPQRIYVALMAIAFAMQTLLGQDVTNVLLVITVIPIVCLVSVQPSAPTRTHVIQQLGTVCVDQASQVNSVIDAFQQPTASLIVKESAMNVIQLVPLNPI